MLHSTCTSFTGDHDDDLAACTCTSHTQLNLVLKKGALTMPGLLWERVTPNPSLQHSGNMTSSNQVSGTTLHTEFRVHYDSSLMKSLHKAEHSANLEASSSRFWSHQIVYGTLDTIVHQGT